MSDKEIKQPTLVGKGYTEVMMKRIGRSIKEKKGDWIDHFDNYIEIMLEEKLISATRTVPEEIVTRAAELADAREKFLDEKFPEGWEA